MQESDRDAAARLVATAMADNPLHAAAYGRVPARRVDRHHRVMRAGFDLLTELEGTLLEQSGTLVGIAGLLPPGACPPGVGQRLRFLPTLASLGLPAAARVARWLDTWARRDPEHLHVHVGPVAVAPQLQGAGLGTVLMREVCRRLDRAQARGYLETDKQANVAFYERFGFGVVSTATVIGVPNWFMERR